MADSSQGASTSGLAQELAEANIAELRVAMTWRLDEVSQIVEHLKETIQNFTDCHEHRQVLSRAVEDMCRVLADIESVEQNITS